MATSAAGPGGEPPPLTVAAVARRLGVAPATLRTWDRRYGVGPSAHTAGAHRRYTPADVARLAAMRRLTLEGVAPAEAARFALRSRTGTGTAPNAPGGSENRTEGRADAGYGAREAPAGRGGGGRVVAVPDARPLARGLARAAMALDGSACSDIVRTGVERDGVVATWDGLLVPVLVGIGERWQATGQGVDVEHLLSECVMGVLGALTMHLREPVNVRPVILACAEEEQHSLPVHVLAAALSERRVAARVLGARVPRGALAAAVRRSGPAAVFVWAQMVATGRPDQLLALPVLRPPASVVVGGPGWLRDGVPTFVPWTANLSEAVAALAASTGT